MKRSSLPLVSACHVSLGLISALAPFSPRTSDAAFISWNAGNGTWTDGTGNLSWSPGDEPDPDDDVVLYGADTVALGSNNSVLSVAMGTGFSLATAGFDLTINGQLALDGAGTDLTINGTTSSVAVVGATATNGAKIILDGGGLTVNDRLSAGQLGITATGTIEGAASERGPGGIFLTDDSLGTPTVLLRNHGTISAKAIGTFTGAPPSGSLSITVTDTVNARIDLDGTSSTPTSVVNVFRNQDLNINGTLSDAYSGDLFLFHNASFDVSMPWRIDSGAVVQIDNGFVPGTPTTQIPAGVSSIGGAAFTQSGGTITVLDADGTLQFDAPFTQTAGSLVNHGLVVFNADATLGSGASFTMPGAGSSLTVNPGVEVNIDMPNFNADGTDTATNIITVKSGGILDLDLTTGGDESLQTVRLNGGELDVTTTDNTWGIVNLLVGDSSGTSRIEGEPVGFGNVQVGLSSLLEVNAASTWNSGASLDIAAGATVILSSPIFAGPGYLGDDGSGTLRLVGSSQVTGATTVSTAVFDWDGNEAGSTFTIANGSSFVVLSPVLDDDGDMDDHVVMLSGSDDGAILNIAGPAQWTMLRTLTTGEYASDRDHLITSDGPGNPSGPSRMILSGPSAIFQVNGSTTVASPLTFGAGSNTIVNWSLTLRGDTLYQGGDISGIGRFYPSPGNHNTVEGDTTISTSDFYFDDGDWVINPGVRLTIHSDQIITDPALEGRSDFDNAGITLNDGSLLISGGEPKFIMSGTMNFNSTAGNFSTWEEGSVPLVIGDDYTGVPDALNVSGAGIALVQSDLAFDTDADVHIAAGATLAVSGTTTFMADSDPESAEFTGAGSLITNGPVNFDQAVALEMSGGTVDLDGDDLTGDTVRFHAPVVIRAAAFAPFGRANTSATNAIDIFHESGTANDQIGSLDVQLDAPATSWTLNPAGVMNLTTYNQLETLLAGADVIAKGTVNVTGDVRTAARLDISGTVNVLSAGKSLVLAGGGSVTRNTLAGGTIHGPGVLAAENLIALEGSGTIHADIGFVDSSSLWAKGGELLVTGDILDCGVIGTADASGVLNIASPWSSAGMASVTMNGGELNGGALTNGSTMFGIIGHGLLSSQVINNTKVTANDAAAPLVFQAPLHDNDWDGTTDTGILEARQGATLELRDNLNFSFRGGVIATSGSTVLTQGFGLDLQTDSDLQLTGSTFRSTGSSSTGGAIHVGAGADSRIEVGAGQTFLFRSTSDTLLAAGLQLAASQARIESGAGITGVGPLKILAGSSLLPDTAVSIGVPVQNSGTFSIAGSAIGSVNVTSFTQTAGGIARFDLTSPGTTPCDRLTVGGNAQLAGKLELALAPAYVPAVGDLFTLISSLGTISGTFDPIVQPAGMPVGMDLELAYQATSVQARVVAEPPLEVWLNLFPSLSDPADRLPTADPDGDGFDNLTEFALDGHPASGTATGKVVGKWFTPSIGTEFTLTLPVRNGATINSGGGGGGGDGPMVLVQTTDGLTYRIEGSGNLEEFLMAITEITGADATAIQTGLPALRPGWTFRTFRGDGNTANTPRRFMRVEVSE